MYACHVLEILKFMTCLSQSIAQIIQTELDRGEIIHVGYQLDDVVPDLQHQHLVVALLEVDYRFEQLVFVL